MYCLIFFINLFDKESPSKRANDANGSGRGLYGGMETLPPLQHLLYTTARLLLLLPILSAYQKTALQEQH
jgi:hypothetical protein